MVHGKTSDVGAMTDGVAQVEACEESVMDKGAQAMLLLTLKGGDKNGLVVCLKKDNGLVATGSPSKNKSILEDKQRLRRFSGQAASVVDFLLMDEGNCKAWASGGSSRFALDAQDIEGRGVVPETDSRDGHLSECDEEESLTRLAVEKGYESNLENGVGRSTYRGKGNANQVGLRQSQRV